MAGSAITGTGNLAAAPTAYPGSNSNLTAAIQTIWSKEILFQAMPTLRFEAFAVKKTELGVAPGLQINFMRYSNLPQATPLVEGIRMQTAALTASQYSITVSEHGFAVSVSELLLNASFDDVMASASRLLGRNMAIYLDTQCRDTLMTATSVVFGYDRSSLAGVNDWYNPGTAGAAGTVTTSSTAFHLSPHTIKDGVEALASKNIPRLGETYVAFVHPHQSRRLRDTPEFIEATKYASPGNLMVGEIGRLYDTVFIETTQVKKDGNKYTGIMIGDNAFGHAISLPVELRDGGILDMGREHALGWYSIYGLGLITDASVVKMITN